MSVEIQPIGAFFPTDASGNILNPTSYTHIPPQWTAVLNKIISLYATYFASDLHSVWLRGSLPRGFYVKGYSDLDTFALVRTSKVRRWETATWAREEEIKLKTLFPFLENVEFMWSSFHSDLAAINPAVAMLIKTQSLCLHGEDISIHLPSYRPNKAMAIYFRWIATDVQHFLSNNTPSVEAIMQMMKQILRTGFELVMEERQQYTTDLYWCYSAFSEQFPEKESLMRKALECYLNPHQNGAVAYSLVNSLGNWLVERVKLHFY